MSAVRFVCRGCGAEAPAVFPFRCPRAKDGDDVDHVVARDLDLARVTFPGKGPANPFLRYRSLLAANHLSDRYAAVVERLDAHVAEVGGHGFRATPLATQPALARTLDLDVTLWVKDETGNVSGSHKARHLMGVMAYIEAIKPQLDAPFAISSCGNAALAAAVVARAAGRPLRVFVPSWADSEVVKRLGVLGAEVYACERVAGEAGDPCTLRFREAVREGAIPFSCQGPDNGLAIEGGMTLGWEIASQLAEAGADMPDRIFIQVGGGALASAVFQALREAKALRAIDRLPRLHAVQTQGAHPLERAYRLLRERGIDDVEAALHHAATHRFAFMWPWETEPKSIAHGILDDETYDWLQILRGMLETGGHPIVVSESHLREARAAARQATSIPVDATGSAGLAGLIALSETEEMGPAESSLVIFTGRDRSA